MRIAVLVTCFNRIDYTIRCLESLFIGSRDLDVFLVDDGSTDDTTVRIKEQFSDVTVISGSGDLFWSRGMGLAWDVASQGDYDFYLWLNNDVVLFPSALDDLFSVSKELGFRGIVSGIVNSESGYPIYGGYDKTKRLVNANGMINEIFYLNGNVVLIPRSVFEIVGKIDPVFHHDLGDVDYGLSARKLGISVVSTRKAVSTGVLNDICRERKNNVSVFERFRKLYSPLGSPPKINFYFRRKHYSIFNAIVYYAFQHFLNLIPDSANKLLFGSKYS